MVVREGLVKKNKYVQANEESLVRTRDVFRGYIDLDRLSEPSARRHSPRSGPPPPGSGRRGRRFAHDPEVERERLSSGGGLRPRCWERAAGASFSSARYNLTTKEEDARFESSLKWLRAHGNFYPQRLSPKLVGSIIEVSLSLSLSRSFSLDSFPIFGETRRLCEKRAAVRRVCGALSIVLTFIRERPNPLLRVVKIHTQRPSFQISRRCVLSFVST